MGPSFRRAAFVLGIAAAQSAVPQATPPPTPREVARVADALLADTYAADGPGAAVLVMRGDEVLYRKARGLADLATGRALQPGDVFRIGSVTKQFTAVGVLKLVEAGKLSLSDPVSKFVPGFPNGEHITLLELLNHTAGVKNAASLPGAIDYPLDQDRSTAELVATFEDARTDFAPGEGWAYANAGYVLLGAVIEAASGQPWHDYLRDTLFEPLGLAHTGWGGDPVLAAQVVQGYSIEGGSAHPARAISMTIPHAAAGLVSTVDDLARWNRALHEGRVLAPATYARMITPTGKAVDAGYGFGIGHDRLEDRDLLAHSGGIFGFGSMLDYVQGPDISVVVLQNADRNPGRDSPGILARKLAAAALASP